MTFFWISPSFFSMLRIRPCGKSCFMVEFKAASTPSCLAELHPPRCAELFPVLWLRPPNGISVLVIQPIM
jgi:hypothetical protein